MPTDAVETKVLSMLDALQNGVVSVAGQVVKYAPDVMDAALVITRVNGIQSFVYGIVALIGCSVSVYVIFKAWKLSEDRSYDIAPVFLGIGGVISGIISGLIAIGDLFDIWNYIAIFEPKIYIAHQIVQQVLK